MVVVTLGTGAHPGKSVYSNGGSSAVGAEATTGGQFVKSAIKISHTFRQEEDGVALAEYLILLALLIGGVLISVTAAGGSLSTVWTSWSTWWTANFTAP